MSSTMAEEPAKAWEVTRTSFDLPVSAPFEVEIRDEDGKTIILLRVKTGTISAFYPALPEEEE